jgi:hypothetical protein
MEALGIVLASSITAASVATIVAIGFLWKLPPRKDRWQQCPTCKRWEKAR